MECGYVVADAVGFSNNHLMICDAWTYTFDGNENLAWKRKSSEKWSYSFNEIDQMTNAVKWTKSGQTWTTQGEYWYGPNGMMVKSLQGGTATYYVCQGHDPLMEKTGSTSTYYAYVNGRMFAKLVGPDIYYYIRDALGSVRQIWRVGATSATFSVATYAPFGTPVGVSGTDQKWKYAGEMIVSAAGSSPWLYYIGARWMAPGEADIARSGAWEAVVTTVHEQLCVLHEQPAQVHRDPTHEFSLSKWWDILSPVRKHWLIKGFVRGVTQPIAGQDCCFIIRRLGCWVKLRHLILELEASSLVHQQSPSARDLIRTKIADES